MQASVNHVHLVLLLARILLFYNAMIDIFMILKLFYADHVLIKIATNVQLKINAINVI
jgi:hypothetical protein